MVMGYPFGRLHILRDQKGGTPRIFLDFLKNILPAWNISIYFTVPPGNNRIKQRPLNPKWPTGSARSLNLKLFWPSDHLSQNKFFDSIIPYMRTSKIQNGRRGLERSLPSGFWGSRQQFLNTSTPSMRKVDNGEENKKNTSLAAKGVLERCLPLGFWAF